MMAIVHKTFTKVVDNVVLDHIANAMVEIDNEINQFLETLHWSMARDAFQTIVPLNDALLITRTLVYTTEQLAFTPQSEKPPV